MARSKKTTKKPLIICLEGIHGVGKTTVFEYLKRNRKSSKYKFYNERLTAKPLWPFGSPDKQIAFRAENHFMQQMVERNEMLDDDVKHKRVKLAILDRSAISVMVYSKALDLPPKDFKLFDDYLNGIKWLESVIFYLEATPETLCERIIKREKLEEERKEWNENDLNYIARLKKYYEVYLAKFKHKIKIIRINTENRTPEEVAQEILEYIEKLMPKSKMDPGQGSIDDWFK